MKRSSALLLLALTALLWSTSGVLVKFIPWSPAAIASFRGLTAGLTMCLLLPGGFHPRRLTKRHWLTATCLAALSICFVTAMKMTAAANVTVLQYTAPLWTGLLAPIWLRERTSGLDWLLMGVIFLGVTLFFVDGLALGGLAGNALAAASGLLFGLQAMSLRSIKDSSPADAVIMGHFLAFLVVLPAWGPPWPPLSGWLALIFLGVFQMGLPYCLYALAVPKVSALELLVVPMIEPILCPLWVFLLMDERPGPWAWAGGLTVIVAVTFWGVLKARAVNRLT
ncbi:MAG: DMT family transporter [Deltaproteobacteria bacterium]|jgi:drug/metabolite transporter (DMT)-like permease|nr:DMT family transporter [Deltaproteobacteria bacterium]